MLRCIPTSKAKVNSAHESHHMVHNQNLLVMSPEEGIGTDLVGRALDKDVGVEIEERVFGVGGIDGDGGADVAVDNDEDFDAFLRFLLEQAVNTPFLGDGWWTAEVLFPLDICYRRN